MPHRRTEELDSLGALTLQGGSEGAWVAKGEGESWQARGGKGGTREE